MKYYHLFSALLFSLVFAPGCKHDQGTSQNALAPSGHQRMIAILDSIAQHADPQTCYNLNSKRAEYFKQQMAAVPAEQRVFAQFKYAEQLLYAGKTEAALVQLSEIVQGVGDQLNEQTKVVYEILAVCYLRLGEQQNCVDRYQAESCIIPIKGGGIYTLPAGPENAIKVYERLLEAFPNDLQSRWLMNIAYMNLGKYPQGVPAKWLVPEQVFKSKGDISFKSISPLLGLDMKGLSGGVCMEDFDGDGFLDFFMTSYGLSDQARFFKNNGDGSFSDRTHEANLDGITSGLNTLHADYDNDGDQDILVLRGGWLEGGTHPNSLLRNNGNAKGTGVTFTDVTIEAGLLSFHPTQAASWADFDGDGWLDLYIANETRNQQNLHPNELYKNNGNGTFTNMAQPLGMNMVGFYKACVWGDVNNDRLPDLYISNLTGSNLLFVNRGGRFEEMAAKAGVGNPLMSFPCWFFDYDNDGRDDIAVVGYNVDPNQDAGGEMLAQYLGQQPQGDWFRLYHNDGNEHFTDIAPQAGLNTLTFGMGCNFGDLDLDGWPDFYLGTGKPDFRSLVPNRMFRNIGGERFEDITMNGFAHIQKGHGVAFGDLDNDGDQEVYEVMGGAYEGDVSANILFENPGKAGQHWIEIELEGVKCNRNGIGSKIGVHTVQKGGAKRTVWATVNTGGSFGSGSLRQEMGLGQAERIESVEVVWAQPGPAKAVYTNVPMDGFIKIKEGSTQVEQLQRSKISLGGKPR